MTNRRQFIRNAAALATLATSPHAAFGGVGSKMMTRQLPGTDERLAVVGLGNARAFGDGDMAVSGELIDLLLQFGGGYVDASGPARFTVSDIMANRAAQDRLFVGTYIEGRDLPSMRDEIRVIQNRQGGGPLDLLMTRAPKDMLARANEYQALRDDGLVRHVGVGRPNKRFYPEMKELMRAGVIDVVQVNYSMIEPEAADEILPLAVERKIAIVINRAFVNGEYFGIVGGQTLPEWAAEFDCHSWAQFSLKYILADPAVNCVLTETSNPDHAIDNLGAGVGRLPDEATRRRMQQLVRRFMSGRGE